MAKVGYRWIWMAFGFLVLVLIFAESGLPAEDDRFWLVKLRAIHTNRNSGNSSFLNGESNIDADDEAMLMAAAHRVAHRLGYRVARRVAVFERTFLFERLPNENPNGKRTSSSSSTNHRPLHRDAHIAWAEQQSLLERTKRPIITTTNPGGGAERYPPRNEAPNDRWWFSDELWPAQWYLQDGQDQLNLNVLAVYERGWTGRGVRVAVLDDGLEHWHEDLAQNYDPSISYDVNNDRPDPRPDQPTSESSHGTRCAGEIAMAANNGKCGVGVAFNARIGGIKLLGGPVFDVVEAMALGHAWRLVDVYSASWGPPDSGWALERPGRLAQLALERGVRRGRDGRGSVFVWASGNGGRVGDNCNCDGYAGSRLTVTIGSASRWGRVPWYGERCSAILAVTYSSGAAGDPMVASTDVNNACTVRHTGTSASAPLAAGIIALALEANPELGWRDIQHLIVRSSNPRPLWDNGGWTPTAAGLLYNTAFGFGLMNADRLVRMATSNWTIVPPARADAVRLTPNGNGTGLHLQTPVHLTFDYPGPIHQAEHIELLLTVRYPRRGAIAVYLTSPLGTRVQLLSARPLDRSGAGFAAWPLMSVATWAEDPRGVWRALVVDEGENDREPRSGSVGDCTLIVHGT